MPRANPLPLPQHTNASAHSTHRLKLAHTPQALAHAHAHNTCHTPHARAHTNTNTTHTQGEERLKELYDEARGDFDLLATYGPDAVADIAVFNLLR